MRALLDDASVLKHVDAVGVAHGAEAVRDDEARALLHEPFERFLDLPLRFRVHTRGGLIEQQNRRIAQQGARDADALLFAHAEFDAALADVRVELVRQPFHEFGRVGALQHVPELRIGGVAFPDEQVLPHGAVEEEALLRDVADLTPQAAFADRFDRRAIDRQLAFVVLVETGEQIDERGLPSTRGADERDGLAGQRVDGDAVDRRQLAGVAETDVVVADVAFHVRERHAVVDAVLFFRVHDAENAFTGRASGLDELVQAVELLDGIVEKPREEQKGRQIARFHVSVHDGARAEPQHDQRA